MADTPVLPDAHAQEVSAGARFEFGKNWSAFLRMLDEDRIAKAERSLVQWLDAPSLAGLRFLDIGSGSGLFSLAARRLGANVRSFDYDPDSVACTSELRRRYFADDGDWTVEQGSVLDPAYLQSLGHYDVVYSWGVLHHTGRMWDAIDGAAARVAPRGRLFIAIYNHQGGLSRLWLRIKRTYNRLPTWARAPFVLGVMMPREARFAAIALVRGSFGAYLRNIRDYAAYSQRGMSYWHDLVDWVGGLPFEVATPEEIVHFLRVRGFDLDRLATCGGALGCNQFVFVRTGRA